MSVTITAPDRSLQQRLEALQKANTIRSRRAELKRDLKARRRTLTPFLEEPPEWLLSAKVYELCLALPKVGRTKAGKLLRRAEVSPSKTIGGLSRRQRLELVALLKGARL
jgi:hypothetical protein